VIYDLDFSNSIELKGKLRFSIRFLQIKYKGNWFNLPNRGEYEGVPYSLDEILFDTGNEAGYCRISSIFLEPFRIVFDQIKLKTKTENLLITEEK
jgi:hypothetical protein